MILLALFLAIVACQADFIDDVPDCLEASNTTVSKTKCTIVRCNCSPCYKNLNFSEPYCLFTTNTTMTIDNTTWLCPMFNTTSVKNCEQTHAVFGTIVLTALAIGGCVLFCACVYWIFDSCRNKGYISL